MGDNALHKELKLIQAAQKDRRYFKHLYTAYYEQIYFFVLRRCESQDTAADLTQQSFIKAMLNLEKYQYKGLPFSAWLYRIALNEVNLYYRNNKFDRTVNLDEHTFYEFTEELAEEDSEQDLMPLLVKVLNALSEDELILVEMKFFEKRSHAEICMILNISEANAKVKLHRVIKKMRTLIESK